MTRFVGIAVAGAAIMFGLAGCGGKPEPEMGNAPNVNHTEPQGVTLERHSADVTVYVDIPEGGPLYRADVTLVKPELIKAIGNSLAINLRGYCRVFITTEYAVNNKSPKEVWSEETCVNEMSKDLAPKSKRIVVKDNYEKQKAAALEKEGTLITMRLIAERISRDGDDGAALKRQMQGGK